MGFFYGEIMTGRKKPVSKKPRRKITTEDAEKEQPQQEQPDGAKNLNRRSLVKKAYQKVSAKLDDEKQSSKAIDDLVKLLKLEKDLGEDTEGVKEIKVRWEQNEDESSSEG